MFTIRALIKRLNNQIPDNVPKPLVLGLILCLAGASLMLLAFLLAQLKWMGLYQIVFWLMFVLILGFLGCVVWFLIEFTTGRRTPWRQRENT